MSNSGNVHTSKMATGLTLEKFFTTTYLRMICNTSIRGIKLKIVMSEMDYTYPNTPQKGITHNSNTSSSKVFY